MSVYLWIALTLIADGIAGLSGALFSDGWIRRYNSVFVALAAGALLAAAFLDLLPESFAFHGPSALSWAFAGFLGLALIEWAFGHHHRPGERPGVARTLPASLLVADGLHNIGDGAAITAAFLVSTETGVATAIAVIAHEVPQEVGDFAVLRASGMSRARALAWLGAMQLTAFAGALGVILMSEAASGVTGIVLSVAAGTFVYIGATDLLPLLHASERTSERRGGLAGFIAGVGLIVVASAFHHDHPASDHEVASHVSHR